MGKELIVNRLQKLREVMKEQSVDVYLITSTDFHGSEYVSDCFKFTEYLSGCTSDNVVLIVETKHASDDENACLARLWTDGRYFISAKKELDGTGIELMRMGEPGVRKAEEYLQSCLKEGMCLAYDARCIRAQRGSIYRQIAAKAGAAVRGEFNPVREVWPERPDYPKKPVWIMDETLAGESVKSKIERVKIRMGQRGTEALILNKPDEIMWLLNLRGSDIAYNPVALSYLVLNGEEVILYLMKEQTTDVVLQYANENGFVIRDYEDFFEDLAKTEWAGHVMIDPLSVSDAIMGTLAGTGIMPVAALSPVMSLKAVKNETELKNIREIYLEDSAAVCRFLCKLDQMTKSGFFTGDGTGQSPVCELDLARMLDDERSTIEGYLSPSFETISAFGENAAIVHYEPKEETQARVREGNFLLLDSGGQYTRGTTDITRTVFIGNRDDETFAKMKEHFTYVAVANLRLLTAEFRYGCTGANLDSIPREVLWEHGLDYNHGTGHGIGYCLNVHEGPQNISWRITRDSVGANTVFEPGMITSDEPGIYLEGEYGIRTESVVECVKVKKEEDSAGFLKMQPLTYVPIDLRMIDPSRMDASDRKRLNDYHEAVYEKISPLLKKDEEIQWLFEATRPI